MRVTNAFAYVLIAGAVPLVNLRAQQPPSAPDAAGNLAEAALIARIQKLGEPPKTSGSRRDQFLKALPAMQESLRLSDELLARFPESSFRTDAMIVKLRVLSALARSGPIYIERFRVFTDEIARSGASGRLASEGAFYAIQAFVFGSRHEKTSEDLRLRGTRERYDRFLTDYPDSARRPVVWASLIRNLIALGQTERATQEAAKLKWAFPDHSATRRAGGEVFQATAVGKPYRLEFVAHDGTSIDTAKNLGQVVLVHFWATWSPRSLKGLSQIVKLQDEFAGKGLVILGVNADRPRRRFDDVTRAMLLNWPQHFDGKGFENKLIIANGVVKLPAYFVVDRRGILRSTDPGDGLSKLIEELLAEPASPTPAAPRDE